ncbi:MAG: 3-dehydroquinate synthase [Fluviicola sp.]|nr:MAG: 3-dehydroquinate synthase [Fluviicola sp.]
MVKRIESSKNRVEIGSILESSFQGLLDNEFSSSKKIVIVDENTQEHCWPYLLTTFDALHDAEVIVLPSGEENKVMEVSFQVWEAFTNYGVQRGDLVINLGGGVVTDMGGFIASVYKRGLRFINVPTSLLAMIDASVGGKTGINLGHHKNQLGVFSFPELTICDPIFLKTLPQNQFVSGTAEMLKHAIISSEKHWNDLKSIDTDTISTELIFNSIQIKAEVVDNDPTEKGLRKVLNLGHTVGHAIEGLFMEENRYSHGECVAWGILVESAISAQLGFLQTADFEEISDVIRKRFPIIAVESDDFDELIALMKHDKKNNSSKINFSLPTKIGAVIIDQQIEEKTIKEALELIFVDNK